MRRHILIRLVAGFVCSLAVVSGAIAQQPTPAQIQAFRSLPADQQRSALQQMGAGDVGQPVVVSSGAAEQPVVSSRPVVPPQLQGEGRFAPGESLILEVRIGRADAEALPDEPTLEPSMHQALTRFRDDVLAGNPYRLSSTGVLRLPGDLAIPLAGLTAGEAAKRLNSESALASFSFTVSRLPVQQPLQPFGYDVFKSAANSLAAPQEGPVPADYVLGPGDTLSVQLIGNEGGQYLLEVNRDGAINLPVTGPLVVAGLRFPEARALIEEHVNTGRVGLTASVSMGSLRTIMVYVLGDVERPGSYAVSGLARITTALYAASGVRPIGSLRNVELRRSGVLAKRIDLYDLLLSGNSANDARLLPGDVVFVPPVGVTASIDGEVRRPATYEVKEGAAASELLYLAGGLTPEGDPRTAHIERISERRNRTVIDLDLGRPEGRSIKLQAGDVLRIGPILETFENVVRLEGHVQRPRALAWREGMRLSDLIPGEAELQPFVDTHYVLIQRQSGAERSLSVLSADLAAALAARGGAADVRLEPRDVVTVFDLATSRERVMTPLLKALQRQSSAAAPAPVVSVGGSVKVAGRYPLEPGMRVSDLIRAGGGYADPAYIERAELMRYEVVNGEERETEVRTIDLRRMAAGDREADIELRPFDSLLVKRVPAWSEQESITISGEVRFPGTYPIRRGETLRGVLERAGGLTRLAFPAGSVFTRTELRQREQAQMTKLAERMQSELASLTLQQAQSAQTATTTADVSSSGRALLAELRSTRAVGRLVIDLPDVLRAEPGSKRDVVLRDGDALFIPRETQEVTVIGEVQNSTSHFYRGGLTRDQYVDLSGGTTRRADNKRIYVVRADGGVALSGGSKWFSRNDNAAIRPGDTIVVPIDAERMRPLPAWQAVTQILYNIAIATAAVHSIL